MKFSDFSLFLFIAYRADTSSAIHVIRRNRKAVRMTGLRGRYPALVRYYPEARPG